MKIKADPIMNLDTEQVLDIDKPRNMTRGMLHRILNKYQIQHDVNWGYEALINLMVTNNVPFEPLAPGDVLEDKTEAIPSLSLEDIQKQMAVLQEMMLKILNPNEVKKAASPAVKNSGEKTKLKIVKTEKKIVKPKEVRMMPDGFPTSTWVLHKWCRDRNIPTKKTDKRDELIEKLKEYANHPDEHA